MVSMKTARVGQDQPMNLDLAVTKTPDAPRPKKKKATEIAVQTEMNMQALTNLETSQNKIEIVKTELKQNLVRKKIEKTY